MANLNLIKLQLIVFLLLVASGESKRKLISASDFFKVFRTNEPLRNPHPKLKATNLISRKVSLSYKKLK